MTESYLHFRQATTDNTAHMETLVKTSVRGLSAQIYGGRSLKLKRINRFIS
jgi:hypothetical protein